MKKIIVFLLLCITSTACAKDNLEKAYCFRVSDGDSISVQTKLDSNVKIRLYGIDSPEKNQELGKEATEFTNALVYEKNLKIEVVDIDRYKRSVAIVYLEDDSILQEHLIENGLAMVYPQYCKLEVFCDKLYNLENKAKEDRVGLWGQDKFIAPWEFRGLNR